MKDKDRRFGVPKIDRLFVPVPHELVLDERVSSSAHRFAPIRLAVAAADAPAHGMTLADFAPTSAIAQEYRQVAEQLIAFLEARL